MPTGKRWKTAGRLLRALAMGIATLSVAHAQAQTSPQEAAHGVDIVLVHGAFVDGSSWSRVIALLQQRGYRVTAVQNPLSSLAADVSATRKVIERQPHKVLLVGHSWGGAVISEAGNDPHVKGLVYLSALAPDSGESVAQLLKRLQAPMEGLAPDSHGLIWLDDSRSFGQVMANDLTTEEVAHLTAVQQPIAAAAFGERIGHAAWHDKPAWYLVTEDDHALPTAVQRALASAMGAQVRSIRSSHLSLLSHPEFVADLIETAARNVELTP
ncbi:alpha/beta hydrolase [Robbsia andropogonis]|uniref:Alpha/beta hydrolase n=2 Tax=Robbsia andropogonis TaxID=28092 RepID=A0A0F5JTP4_9BURK|nr:alpha/beta hydrolase [Robbsia andropogonis]KKB61015.1 alpha/beta hydrolase [Robbsia andropogonis]MCP1131478.1 alpha/beta hydrolase [Robbsia andropogonis]